MNIRQIDTITVSTLSQLLIERHIIAHIFYQSIIEQVTYIHMIFCN